MPLQILAGHWSGEIAHEYQPAKVAAMEGWCETRDVQGTVLLAWPADNACGRSEITIPGTSPFLFNTDAPLRALSSFAEDERPPLWLVFWGFRIMVGSGLLLLALGVWGVVLWARKRIDQPGLFHWLAIPGGSLGFVAVITGWIVAEVGRQPWTVYGMLRTADSVSPVEAGQVAFSLIVFITVYAIIFTAGALYMARIATRGFDDRPPDTGPGERRAPGSPLGAVTDPAQSSAGPAANG